MRMRPVWLLAARWVLPLCLASASPSPAQEQTIGIIDFFGLERVSAAQAREALRFKEGDTLASGGDPAPSVTESESRLRRLPGVRDAKAHFVCCDQGKLIAFVGIVEEGTPSLRFRTPPRGTVRLAPDVVQAGDEAWEALLAAIRDGNAGEDLRRGYALSEAPGLRAIQERFVTYAARDLRVLRRVLRDAGDAKHRALAAQILGYAPVTQAVVDDLVRAMRDPAEGVRNNAMRALLVFGHAAPGVVPPNIRIPWEPFAALLQSPVWTDRNKAAGALEGLTRSGDPRLLAALRKEAIAPLSEMARWKSSGHAVPAFLVLARIAGYTGDQARAAWDHGERDVVIDAARRGKAPAR